MCGIVGITGERAKTQIAELGLWQNHRGPDGWGEFHDVNFSLGHNRLSILDIEGGSQPMGSDDENLIIVFNGEIYNYLELRLILLGRGYNFRSNSDTEVILNGFIEWGVELFPKLRGMFALCIYNRERKEFVLSRDPIGIKPLYYCRDGSEFIFASELKPIVRFLKKPVFNETELNHYFLHRSTSIESTFIKDVFKILPGHFYEFKLSDLLKINKVKYHKDAEIKNSMSYVEKQNELDTLLYNSVKIHMRSDVPVGIFLSGGVDSSLISCYASQMGDIKGFNIGIAENEKMDETPYAKKAASTVGIDLKTKYLNNEEVLNNFEKWCYYNDDPVGDPSAMALMSLSDYARDSGYKVMLSGEGADELFLGYFIYQKYLLRKLIYLLPKIVVRLIPFKINALKDWEISNRYMGAAHISNQDERNEILMNKEFLEFQNTTVVNLCDEFKSFDIQNRLPNDILVRTDRATMAYSIEARVPFLINEIIDFSRTLTLWDQIDLFRRKGKRIVKDIAARKFPKSFINRRKMGFEIPVQNWINQELRPQIDLFVFEKRIPGIDYSNIRNVIAKNNVALVWSWLILEKWYRNWFLGKITQPEISPSINKVKYGILSDDVNKQSH